MYCENPYSFNFESDCGELVSQSSRNPSGFTETWVSGAMPFRQSLVLDGEKGELVKASGKMGKKIGASETKTIAALKSHSEAERRRREKINAHLASLRGLVLVPNNEKMDKATLLAEVVSQVKQLKIAAAQASKGLHIPMDTDEVEVEILENNAINSGSFLLRASFCCDYRPDLLSNVRQALVDLHAQILKSEISTLGGRLKTVFLITTSDNTADGARFMSSVRAALSNILDKFSASAEFSQELFFPRKRQRVSCIDSSLEFSKLL